MGMIDPNPWKHLPSHYVGRWGYDYEEKNGEGWFYIHCGGHIILRTEDSEVADAVCRAHNAVPAAVGSG